MRNSASQRSRIGPAGDRSQTPPAASGANASTASAQPARSTPAGSSVMARTPRQSRARPASWRGNHPAASAGAGGAGPSCDRANMRFKYGILAFIGGKRPGGTDQRQLTTQAIGAQDHAKFGGAAQAISLVSILASRLRAAEIRRRIAFVTTAPGLCEAFGIAVKGIAAAHDLDPNFQLGWCFHIDRQAEPIQQLRPEFAFLGVATADQNETRGVPDAQAFALDHILARRGNIQQDIDQMVLKEIDFVDIEEAAMALANRPGWNAFSPRARARSRSSAPTTRSSVAPSGRSTTGTARDGFRRWRHAGLRPSWRWRQCSQDPAGRAGSQA